MNRRKVLCAAVVAFLPALALAGVDTISPPEVIPTISPDDLNGISLSPDGLSGVAVGNNGAIIQFDGQNVRGGVVASGTTKDLYDVDVVSKNLAFISGRDIVMHWNAINWNKIDSFGALLPAWGTPEGDLMLFNYWNEGGVGSSFRNAYDPVAGSMIAGSYAGPLDLYFCGHSDDIKLMREDGGFEVIGNDRQVKEFNSSPLEYSIDPPLAFTFTAAWIPESECLEGPFLPKVAYGVAHGSSDIYKFDGANWQLDYDVPAGIQVTSLAGLATDHVLAVGYKGSVDNPGQNQGVILKENGSGWQDITASLFPGTEIPGLGDMAVAYSHQSCIHDGGFEDGDTAEANDCVQPPSWCAIDGSPGDCSTARIAGEEGNLVVLDKELVPDRRVDVAVTIQSNGDPTDMFVRVTNDGPDQAEDVVITVGSLLTPDAGCGLISSGKSHKGSIAVLNVGDVFSCHFSGAQADQFPRASALAVKGSERYYTDNSVACAISLGSCHQSDPRSHP